jgi:hypothetical protein
LTPTTSLCSDERQACKSASPRNAEAERSDRRGWRVLHEDSSFLSVEVALRGTSFALPHPALFLREDLDNRFGN